MSSLLLIAIAFRSAPTFAQTELPNPNSSYKSGSFPSTYCKSWNGTLTEISGANTNTARMSGVVTKDDLLEYCSRWASQDKAKQAECLKEEVARLGGEFSLTSTADCSAGRIKTTDEKEYQLRGLGGIWLNGSYPLVWQHVRTGKILDDSCASGAPPITEQFKILCPAAVERLVGQSRSYLAPAPGMAGTCEVAKIMFGNIRLEIVDRGSYESALVRHNDFNNREQNYGTIRGEITVDRGGFAVRNVQGVVVGAISPQLQIEGFDQVCDKSKPVMVRRVQPSVYAIVNGDDPVGMIKGRFPKNSFGVDDAPLPSQAVRRRPGEKAFFVGRWHLNNPKLCRGRPGETEGLFAYTERQAIAYESSCDIVSITPQANRLELKMKCASEGMTSDEREVVQLTRNGHLTRTTFTDGKTYTFEYARCP